MIDSWHCTCVALQEDRYAQIERDNRLLLEKMSQIMRKGGIDNYNNTAKYSKSLNREARKRELHKITRENQVQVATSNLSLDTVDPSYMNVKHVQ